MASEKSLIPSGKKHYLPKHAVESDAVAPFASPVYLVGTCVESFRFLWRASAADVVAVCLSLSCKLSTLLVVIC